MGELTKADLENINWGDMTIKETGSGEYSMIFLFKTKEDGEYFLDIIHNHSFVFRADVTKDTREYVLTFEFKEGDYEVQYLTSKSTVSKEELSLLKTDRIKYITAGVKLAPKDNDTMRILTSKRKYKLGHKVNLN